tara:strand:+ start:1332 stop:1658 length:327 start_codon:yes stop_codon:yes gene_type:complete
LPQTIAQDDNIDLPTVRRDETASSFPAHFRIPFSGLNGDSLVTRVNQLNAHVGAAHKEGIEVATMETESYSDTELVETLCKEITTEKFAAFGLFEIKLMGRHIGAGNQ